MGSQATNTAERVGVAEGVEPAAANEDPAPAPLSLKQRMAAIREDAFGIGKDNIKMKSKAGVEFTIRGHTVEAVLSEMRPLFAKHGVDVTPTLVERTYSGNRCDILVDFTFERTDDSDESRVVRWAGAGTDDGDKGFSKAGTNALKEMLKKVFLITDRDDAKEEEEKVEHKPEGGATRAEVDDAKERTRAAIEQWGKTFKAALDGADTEKEVDRLRLENQDQLSDPALSPVTRQFFFDHIQRRKAEIKAKGQ